MKLFDLKAGMHPAHVRIFLAEKGIDIPHVEVDMQGGENQVSIAPDAGGREARSALVRKPA